MPTSPRPAFRGPYDRLKRLARRNIGGEESRGLLGELATIGFTFLESHCTRIRLTSQVSGKTYVAFQQGNSTPSRPVRRDLFPRNESTFQTALAMFMGDLATVATEDATKAIYAVTMAFCAANDASKRDDRKTPATFFEILVAHLFSRVLGVQPRRSIQVPDFGAGDHDPLPTDYWFDLGRQRRKIHLPVKTSTRERAIQAWAHQRILDGVFGTNSLTGVLVSLAETKLDRSTLEVVEICVPDQWRLYQRYVAHIDRAYYLDPPSAYTALAPTIQVKPIGDMFQELDTLTGPI